MIKYQDKTVTAKTFAKHKISDRLMEVFDNPQLHLGPEFQNFTTYHLTLVKNTKPEAEDMAEVQAVEAVVAVVTDVTKILYKKDNEDKNSTSKRL